MNLHDIEKIISIDNSDEFFTGTNSLDSVNKYLSEGWKLLAIDSIANDDHTSHIHQYVLGFPKLDSSK